VDKETFLQNARLFMPITRLGRPSLGALANVPRREIATGFSYGPIAWPGCSNGYQLRTKGDAKQGNVDVMASERLQDWVPRLIAG
jgi:hypothetical protein